MGNSKRDRYYASLKSKKWAKVRLRVFERDNRRCTVCGSKDDIVVHHTFYYEDYTEPWAYPISSLLTLCGQCHHDYHSHHETPIRGKNGKIKKPKPPKPPKKKKRKVLSLCRTAREARN